MKQVEVSILGQVYMLGCPEGGEALLATAVAAVDKEMTAIRDGGKVKARERIAVLAALNLAFDVADRGVRELPVQATRLLESTIASNMSPDPRLAALMARMDAALADDGQLL